MEENMRIHGYIEVTLYDSMGDIKVKRRVPNIIVTEGFDHYLDAQFNSSQPAQGTFLAIGTTATSLAEGNSALEAEVDRQGGTYSHTGNTKSGTVAYTWGAGTVAWAIKEMALFDAASSGTMICRGTFAAVNKGTADTFEGKYIHTLS